MCTAKPKIVSAPTQGSATEKEPAILRNPYLDGLNPIIKARQGGVRSLRIDRLGAGVQMPTTPDPVTPPLTPTPTRPPLTPRPGGGTSPPITGGGGGRGLNDLYINVNHR